ncbi:hypothetical protein D3Z36_15910 [Lachnospiraceae bacterium]|nr:hypothetical protein [Lachnospiraceae bacterium]
MTERELERLDIIKKLVGNTRGYGETNADNAALKNIEFARNVLAELIEPLVKNARYDGCEASRQDIKEASLYAIEEIEGLIAGE